MMYFPTVALRAFLLVFPCWQVLFTGAQDIPTTTCKEYVVEGETLACYCTGSCSNGKKPTLTWPHHSNTSRLEKHNISRQQHGQNITCRRVCGHETTEVNYTLQVAYGPDAASSKITGPSPFITNGTLSMTLTCEAIVNPIPFYTWGDVICDNGNDDRTCTYTPPITEDGKLVKCDLINPENNQARPVTVDFATNLSYPPQTAPTISGHVPGQILKTGDTLNCTVSGGKPLVTNVIFICTNPQHQDEEDVRTGVSVSSSLVIDTSGQSSTGNMTCSCSARWDPLPELYSLRAAEASFQTDYSPFIEQFTVNGQPDLVTFQESNQTNFTMTCYARGHPSPRMFLVKRTGDDLKVLLGQETDNSFGRVLTYTTSQVARNDMGLYTCFAINSIEPQNKKEVQVNIECSPQPPTQTPPNSRENHPELPRSGLSFDVVAYPTPDVFLFFKYESENDVMGTKVSSDIVQVMCVRTDNSSPLLTCDVTPKIVLEKDTGVYQVDLSNGFGHFQFFFELKNQAVTNVLAQSPIAAIVGGVIAGMLFLGIVVVAVVVVWRRKYRRYEKPQPRGKQNSSPYTDLQQPQTRGQLPSVRYNNQEENSEHLQSSVNYVNTESRPDLSQSPEVGTYVNVETHTNTYEQVQPRSETTPNVYNALHAS